MNGKNSELRAIAEKVAINLTNENLSTRIETIYAVLHSQFTTLTDSHKREVVEAQLNFIEQLGLSDYSYDAVNDERQKLKAQLKQTKSNVERGEG